MSGTVLFLAHVDESGVSLPKAAFEVLGAALETANGLGGPITVGLIGEHIEEAANTISGTGCRIVGVSHPDLAHPRYATDAAAIEAICRLVPAEIVIAPATSRFLRILPGVAQRTNGVVDTHITSIDTDNGVLTVRRWFYRQRLEGVIQREARPWFLAMDSGCHEPWRGKTAETKIEQIEVAFPPQRTSYAGIRVPRMDAQTIRPDARLLFVAGAGWCKKQADGRTHLTEAESTILDFLKNSGASLGGSKSLVDQSGENQAVLGFMTHLNQVGQTGSTPRHPKGLSTCCHGEE